MTWQGAETKRGIHMKAMVLRGPNIPFELAEVPDPVAGPGEAVARVITCGSGLTIQHAKAGRRKIKFPRTIGHEITGEIVAVGAGVSGLKVGDGVTSYFYLNCGHCRYCLANLEPLCVNSGGQVGMDCDGGYAEYIKLPAHIFIKYPEGLDYKKHPAEMGVVTDALATPYKVLRRAAVKGGETVAIFGAGGGVGIHQVMMAKWANARVIAIDVVTAKFEACRKAGADEVLNPRAGDVVEALRDLTHGTGVDVAIDYVGATATLEAGVKALGRRGRLVVLSGASQPFVAPAHDMLMNEQAILGSRYVTRAEILETCDLVARGDVWPLVTDIRPMQEAEAVHDLVERGQVTGRAVLRIA
jgi:D-arabinose 1-dehydrogenase-like Zn-dependent alcohol dehydrogenase